MALWNVTVKRSQTSNGVTVEKGMSVEVASNIDPINISGYTAIQDAFIRNYGIDIKKAGMINRSILNIEKIN